MPSITPNFRLEAPAQNGIGDRTGTTPLLYLSSLPRLRNLRLLFIEDEAGPLGQDSGDLPRRPRDRFDTDSGWDSGMTRWPVGVPSTIQSDWHKRIPAPHARLPPPDRPVGRCPTERTSEQMGLWIWDTLPPKAMGQQALEHAVCLLSGATGASLKRPVGLEEGGTLQIFSWDALEAFLRRFDRSNLSRGTFVSPTSGKLLSVSALRRLVAIKP